MSKSKYPIEEEIARLIREFRLLLRKAGKYFFAVPKDMGELMLKMLEILSITFIAWRLLGRW